MKHKSFLIAVIMCCMAVCSATGQTAAEPLFSWGLLWDGSWEEKTQEVPASPVLLGNLYNRGELRFSFLPLGLSSRFQVLDRHPFNIELDPFLWNEPPDGITNFTGGLYHRTTGSRLLFGVLDEWGLSARLRNPWIRLPPYAENHKPLMADLKTAVSSAKKDEAYLYLSTPYLGVFSHTKLRGFLSAQTEAEKLTPAFSGGADFIFAKNTGLLAEMFYTGKTLEPLSPNKWFSDPPPLPQREFCLYGAGLLFSSPDFSVSSDFALSETFAWGKDIYCNFGVTLTPQLSFEKKSIGNRARSSLSRTSHSRPLSISLAADGSGERFVNRDGVNLNEGFRGAAKIEWKSGYNSLIKLDSVLRGNGPGEEINRSSSGFYYRFPSSAASRSSGFPIRFTRISFSADRNAANLKKINDSYSAGLGLNCNLSGIGINNPFGITFSGSMKGETSHEAEGSPIFYPIPDDLWEWTAAGTHCEFIWSPRINKTINLQFRSRVGVSFFVEKEEIWDFSFSAALRFKYGRIALKAASPDLSGKWNWTLSWHLEKKEKI